MVPRRLRNSLLALCLAPVSLSAQGRPPAVFVQLAGEGLGLSANLDVGVTQSIRLRGGAGISWAVGTIPVTVSYLAGRGSSTLELGAGATILSFLKDTRPGDNSVAHWIERTLFLEGQGTRVVGVGILGYRYHPAGGFVGRLGLTPVLYRGRLRVFPGLSAGFSL